VEEKSGRKRSGGGKPGRNWYGEEENNFCFGERGTVLPRKGKWEEETHNRGTGGELKKEEEQRKKKGTTNRGPRQVNVINGTKISQDPR